MFRQGLASLLNREPDMNVEAQCGAVGEALMVLALGIVDFVLLDLDLGRERGIDFLAQARINGFRGPVLVLTAGYSAVDVAELELYGIDGILRKVESVEFVADRVRSIMGSSKPSLAPQDASSEAAIRFSARETSVLRLVVDGWGNKEIAAELASSEPAVKSIVQQLFRKTGTRTRSQVVRFALEQQLNLA
jgi:DNA-binding NarL/FixJ family response regulator